MTHVSFCMPLSPSFRTHGFTSVSSDSLENKDYASDNQHSDRVAMLRQVRAVTGGYPHSISS